MAEGKKPDSSRQPVRDSVDYSEAPCSDQLIKRHQEVTNTRPAPPNPNRDDGSKKERDT